jgi:hypothetical protein
MPNWNDPGRTNAQRGALIRLYIATPTAIPANNGAELNTGVEPYLSAGVGANYAANEHPAPDNVLAFKQFLIRNYREYLDGLALTIRSTISNTQIGILAGTTPDLQTTGDQAFIASVGGVSTDSALLESGVEQEQFMRARQEEAIINPDTYIKNRNIDLKKIEEKAINVYIESFKKYRDEYKMPSDKAREKAMIDKNEYLKLLKRQHDKQFPDDLYKQAKNRIVVKGP